MENLLNANEAMKTLREQITNLKESYIVTTLFVIIGIIVIAVFIVFYGLATLEKRNCDKLAYLYPKPNPKIQNMGSGPDQKYMFRDYYIRTAYNACCTGQFMHSVVSTCALRDVIKQGARCLDFEIYSVNDQPVVATSTLNKNTVKEIYNSVSWKDALGVIMNYAFNAGSCPNADDPLIVHFRFMSTNKKMYDNMFNIMMKQFGTNARRLLEPMHHFLENRGIGGLFAKMFKKPLPASKNLGETPIQNMKKKITFLCANTNRTWEESNLYFFINGTTGSIFCRLLNSEQVRNTPSIQELRLYNKRNMTMVIPERLKNPQNPNAMAARRMGCQMIAVRFPHQDKNYFEQEAFFTSAGSAFVLKPPHLRFVQEYVPAPKKQDKRLSFKTRKMSAPGINFSI